jgi:hypothetical protein
VTFVIAEPRVDVMDRAEAEECPAAAIFYEDNARFFTDPLAGRRAPLGDPGGSARSGGLGMDTDPAASLPTAAGTGAS